MDAVYHKTFVDRLFDVRMEPDKLLIMITNEHMRLQRETFQQPAPALSEAEVALWLAECELIINIENGFINTTKTLKLGVDSAKTLANRLFVRFFGGKS